MGSLLIQYKNVTSRPPSLSLILFLSLNTHFSSIFSLLTSHPFTPSFLIMQTWSWCVYLSPTSVWFCQRQERICLDKDGCSERATEGFRLPWSLSFFLLLGFCWWGGCDTFLNLILREMNKKPTSTSSVVKQVWTLYVKSNKQMHTWLGISVPLCYYLE